MIGSPGAHCCRTLAILRTELGDDVAALLEAKLAERVPGDAHQVTAIENIEENSALRDTPTEGNA